MIAGGIILAATMVASTNVFMNGDCEEVSLNVKASSTTLMRHLRSGWQFGFGPIAYFPKGWWPNGAPGEFRVIDLDETPEKRELVHSGKRSFLLRPVKENSTGIYNPGNSPKKGKYEISFWTKGSGKARMLFATYDRVKHLSSENPGVVSKPSEDWVENRYTFDIGVTPGTHRISVLLYVTDGEVYFDDFSMKPLGVD